MTTPPVGQSAAVAPAPGKKRNRGFTITELMIVVAILGIVSSLAPRVLIEIERFFLMNRTRTTLQRDARASLELITRNLRQAQASTITVDRLAGQPFYSRISFQKDNSTTIIRYYQNGRKLMMKVGNITSEVCSNLRFLSFALPESANMNIVSVSVTLETNTFEGKLKALHLASEKVRIMNS